MTACSQLFVAVGFAFSWASLQVSPADVTFDNFNNAVHENESIFCCTSVNLSLRDTEGLAELFPRTTVQRMTVEGFGSDHGLTAWLESQPDLNELTLICLFLSDTDIQALANMTRLERLDLRGCVVSERGLNQLGTSHSLRELDVRGASISPELLQSLQSKFPHLVIYADVE